MFCGFGTSVNASVGFVAPVVVAVPVVVCGLGLSELVIVPLKQLLLGKVELKPEPLLKESVLVTCVGPLAVCTPSTVMTVCCWVVVWRTIAEWLLVQEHVNWLPSEKVTVAFRTQTWSSTTVCGVSVSCPLPSVHPWMVVKVWLVVVVPLPCGTPFWKFCVTTVVMSSWISACCLAVQPQPVEPPMFVKFAVLLPWQTTCSDLVP